MNPPMIILIILLAGGLVNKCDTENKMAKVQRKMDRIEKQPRP